MILKITILFCTIIVIQAQDTFIPSKNPRNYQLYHKVKPLHEIIAANENHSLLHDVKNMAKKNANVGYRFSKETIGVPVQLKLKTLQNIGVRKVAQENAPQRLTQKSFVQPVQINNSEQNIGIGKGNQNLAEETIVYPVQHSTYIHHTPYIIQPNSNPNLQPKYNYVVVKHQGQQLRHPLEKPQTLQTPVSYQNVQIVPQNKLVRQEAINNEEKEAQEAEEEDDEKREDYNKNKGDEDNDEDTKENYEEGEDEENSENYKKEVEDKENYKEDEDEEGKENYEQDEADDEEKSDYSEEEDGDQSRYRYDDEDDKSDYKEEDDKQNYEEEDDDDKQSYEEQDEDHSNYQEEEDDSENNKEVDNEKENEDDDEKLQYKEEKDDDKGQKPLKAYKNRDDEDELVEDKDDGARIVSSYKNYHPIYDYINNPDKYKKAESNQRILRLENDDFDNNQTNNNLNRKKCKKNNVKIAVDGDSSHKQQDGIGHNYEVTEINEDNPQSDLDARKVVKRPKKFRKSKGVSPYFYLNHHVPAVYQETRNSHQIQQKPKKLKKYQIYQFQPSFIPHTYQKAKNRKPKISPEKSRLIQNKRKSSVKNANI